MPQFAANLSLLYSEHAFLDRFAAAASDGFTAVEFLFLYAHAPSIIRARLQDHGLKLVLMNAPPAGADRQAVNLAWLQGARGTAALPGRESEFIYGFDLAMHYAAFLDCPRVHLMAGCIAQPSDRIQMQATFLKNLSYASQRAGDLAIDILIEPLNARDVPAYFLTRQAQAQAIVAQVAAPNLKVQMDLYHCQMTEGDIVTKLRKYLPGGAVGHIQIAGVPDRHEPDTGELNYPYLLQLIDSLGYSGWVGCEYHPRLAPAPGATTDGLAWRAKAMA